MAITAKPYVRFMQYVFFGAVNFFSDTVNVALLEASYTPNLNVHAAFADVTGEIVDTAYTAGGLAVSNPTFGYTGGVVTIDLDPLTWTALTATFRYAVVYTVGSDASTSPLIGLIDFGTDRTYTGEDFQLSFPSGLLRLAQAV